MSGFVKWAQSTPVARSPAVMRSARIVVGLLAVPLVVRVLFGAVPVGIYLDGLVVGSLYALISMGVILVYRANRVINFAQASLGAVPALAALLLMANHGLPYPVAVVIVLIGGPLLGGLVEVVFIRRFSAAPRVILTLATIGVAQLLGFFELQMPSWIPGIQGAVGEFSVSTPFNNWTFNVAGAVFTGDHLVTVAVVVGLGAGLAWFFRGTRTGRAVRASAENADRAMLMGIPVTRVRTIVWMIAALLSAVAVFQQTVVNNALPAGLSGITSLLYGLAPAVAARMQSFPVALVTGMGLGMFGQAVFYATRNSTVASAILLPIILVALLVQRRSLSRAEDTGVSTWRDVKEFRPIPFDLRALRQVRAARLSGWAVLVGLVVAAPYVAGTGRTDIASLLVIYAIIGISLVILTGWAGQISLGQFALAGIGAAVAGGLIANHGVNFLLAAAVGGLAGAAVAVAIGLPALRLPGLFLAVTTLALAVNMQYFFLQTRYFPWLLPGDQVHVRRPVLFRRLDLTGDLRYYYLCVAVLVLAVACARSLRAHRSGRVTIAVRDNPRSAQSFGINLGRTRLAAFALAGFLAGLAGALLAGLESVVDAPFFAPERSLEVFAMAVIGGLTSIGGALAGALYVVGFDYFLPKYALLATGAGMLGLLFVFPGGLAEVGFTVRDVWLRRMAARQGLLGPPVGGPPPPPRPTVVEPDRTPVPAGAD